MEKLNWLPISNRINQRILSTTFKFVNDMGPNYLNEVFQWAAESNRTLRNDYLKLVNQYLCHNLGYKQKIQVIQHNQFYFSSSNVSTNTTVIVKD